VATVDSIAGMRRVGVLVAVTVIAAVGMLAVPAPGRAGTFSSAVTDIYITPTQHPDLCVTANAAVGSAALRLRSCGEDDSMQRWTITGDDRIQLQSDTTRCIGNPGNNSSANNPLTLTSSCASGATNATWPYQLKANSATGAPAGGFINTYAGVCMAIKDGDITSTASVVRSPCATTAQYEQFSIGSVDMRVTAANTTGKPGATVQPQFTVFNSGPQAASYNSFAVTADTGLTIANLQRYNAASTGYADCTVASATAASCPAGATWTTGSTGTVLVNTAIPADAVPGAEYQVCGTNTLAPTNDVVASNNTACSKITVGYLASDLAMSNTATGGRATRTTVEPNAAVEVPFTLTNNGPDTAGVPKVVFAAPDGFTVTGITGPTGWTCALAAKTCTGPTNTFANTAAAFTVTGTVASGLSAGGAIGDVTATASVSGKSKDAESGNNSAANTLAVDADVTLEVTKTGGDTALPGGPIEYTLTVANDGATGLVGATVTDTVPADIDVDSWTCTATGSGSCGTASGTANDIATTVDVPAGEQAVITVTGTVMTAAAGTTVTNTAHIAMPSGIGNNGTAGASTHTTVSNYTDLEVASEPVTLAPGTSGTVTATVRNNGPADAAEGAAVTLTFPDGAAVSDLDSRCADNGDGTATCTIPAATLTVGASTGLAFTAAVPADTATGTVFTGAAAVDYVLDPNAGNDTADLTVTAGDAAADFDLTATDPDTVVPGQGGEVTFTLRNQGPSTSVTDATVTLQAPPAATWDTGSQPTGCTGTERELTCTVPAGVAPGAETDLTLAYTVDPAAAEGTATGTALVNGGEDANAGNDTAEWAVDVAAASADLHIDKTAAAGTVTPGDQFEYTLTVHNDGPSTAVDAAVTDTLPAQLTYVSATGTGATCEASGPTVTCDYAALAPGTQTITLTAQVDPAYTGTGTDLPNSAAVTAGTADPDTANNTSGTAVPAVGDASADLALTNQTTTDTPIAPGETFTYLVDITDQGPSAAPGTVVTVDLPSALAFVASESGCTGAAGEYGGTVTCEPGALGSGDEAALLIVVKLDPAYTGTGSDAAVTSSAAAVSDVADPDGGNSTAAAGLPGGTVAAARADVSMSKAQITPGPVAPGETITYTLNTLNDGPSTAVDVDITDTLPNGMTFASSLEGCTASGQDVTCPRIASLAPGAAVAYHLAATVDADYTGDGGDLANAATATSAATADPDTANNSDSEQLSPGGVSAPSADLAIAKSSAADAGHVAPGEQFTYTLTVENHGPSDASDVAVTDTLPASVSFVSAAGCTGTVGELGGTVTCGPLGSLPAAAGGNTVAYPVTVELDPAYTGSGTDVVNAAAVASGTADPNSANDSTDLTGVPALAAGEADLSMDAAVVGSPSIAPGGTFTYRASVHNNGPSTAVNPVVTATLGSGMSWDAYPSGCTLAGQTLTCPPEALGVLQLARLATATFDATAKVDASYTGDGSDLTDTATVASDTDDPVAANDTATATGGVTVTDPSADLQATKEITTSGEVIPGGVIDFRVSVANAGPSDAADVTVTDTLPDGLTFAGAANDACTADGQTVTCGPTAVIAAGDTRTHLYRATVDPAYTGTGADLGSTATAAAATADPDTANNTAPEVVPSIGAPAADLRLTKRLDSTAEVRPGETFRYALTVDNLGPSIAQTATLTDTLDDDLAFISSTLDECTISGQTVTCSHDDALPVESHTWMITVRLAADYTGDGSDIANSAAVTADTADPDSSNNTGAAEASPTVAAPSADVAITNAASANQVAPGETFDYTLTVANAGPSTATGIAVTDTLPTGLAFVAADDCTATGQAITCATVDSLAVGAQRAFTFTVRIDPAYTGNGDDLASTATATPTTADPDTANNTATAGVPGGSVAAARADVSLTAAVIGSDPVVPGQTFGYSLTVANAGPSTATGIAVTDALPASLAFVESDDCTADADFGATVICATVDEIAVGGQTTFTVTVRLDPAYTGAGDDIAATAVATPASADPDTANNTAAAGVPGGTVAAAEAAVSITQTAPASAVAGSTAAFTLTVTNTGPSTAQDVTVTDTLPAGLAFASATGADCTADGAVVTCALGAMSPGAAVALTLTADVDEAAPAGEALTNTAEVTTATANTADDTTTSADFTAIAEAAVSLAQTPPGSMTAGAEAQYTFTVQNQGPSDATGVVLTDQLDPRLTFASATGATCTADGSNLLTCEIGTVADGVPASVAVTVRLAADTPAGTRIDNTAELATATANTSPDTTATAAGPEVGVSADLSVAMAPLGTEAVAPGQTFDYEVTVANEGPSDAAAPAVTVELPLLLGFVASPSGCTGTAGTFGRAVTCAAGAPLANGDELTFTLTVKLHPRFTGSGERYRARATVDGETPDPVSDNDTARAGLPTGAAAAPIADLSVVKTLTSSDPVTPGDTFTYELTLTNAGPSVAAGLAFTDTLPAPLRWVQSVPPAAACQRDGNTVACATDREIPVGATRTFTVTVELDASYTGDGSDLVSSGVVSSATADPVPGNNSAAAAAVAVNGPSGDLMLTQGFAAFPGSPIAPGQTTNNLLSLNNYGISTATDVVVTHQLPPELAFVSSIDGCIGEVGVYGGTITCPTIDRLEPNESVFFIVTVRLKPDYVGDGSDISSHADVDASNDDPALPNNDAPATMDGGVSDAVSDLSITKTAPDTMIAGQEAVWTIDAANAGPSTATGVTVTDELDPGTTFVSASPDVCSASGQQVTCALDDLDPGDDTTIELTVLVDEAVDSGTTIENTAAVAAETDTEGDSATAVGPPVRVVTDLAVTKEFDPDTAGPITPGTDFGYLVTVTNLGGSETAEHVTVTDTLPTELAFVAAADADTGEPIACSAAGQAVTCALTDALEPGASVTAAMTVRLDPSYRGDGEEVTNTVAVDSDAVDSDTGNDTASQTGVPGGVGDPVYDRRISVNEGPAVAPGKSTTVEVTVESAGPSTLDGPVSVRIGMPEHTGVVGDLPSDCRIDGDAVVCAFDTDLAPQAEAGTTGLPEAAGPTEALAIAEAAPATSWTASITVGVDEDAPESTYLDGGTAALNRDPNDPDSSSDTATWGVRTSDLDDAGAGDSGDADDIDSDDADDADGPGGLVRTGGDSLALVLTGLGAILAGLVIAAAATRPRAQRR
jgi:large repetitive protein